MLVTQVKTKKEKPIQINFKVDKKTLKILQSQADKYAGKDLSAWLRYAGSHHVPDSKDIIKPSKKKNKV